MKGINLKEVCRQIKASGKRALIWSRQGGFHYITNRHWMFRFPDDRLPREVLVVLFSVFAVIPDSGKTMASYFGEVKEDQLDNMDKIYSPLETANPGKITPFTKDINEKSRMRVVQSGTEFIYLAEEYARMVDQDEVPYCNGVRMPVFFLDGAVIILPYRNNSDKNDQMLLAELVG